MLSIGEWLETNGRRLLLVARRSIGLLAVLALALGAAAVWRGVDDFAAYGLVLDIGYLALSIFTLLLAFAMGALGWWLILRALGGQLDLGSAIRVWLVSQLGKYLPGGVVWYVAGRSLLAEELGLAPVLGAVSMAVEFLLQVAGAACFAVWMLSWGSVGSPYLWLVIAGASGAVVFFPRTLNSGVSLLLRLLGRPGVRVQWRHHVGLMSYYLLQWWVIGTSFWLLVGAFVPQPLDTAFPLAGVYALACVAGYVVPLAPSGLGVREGVLVTLLHPFLPLPVALGAAIIARLWYSAVELACGLLALGFSAAERRHRRSVGMPVK
ncbi:MAG: lysylphosphatidylglycerol synthase domain-containing protein [Chloroflexi bacterium]|nr:lysylphosphatidylglycerol synthase domain-containing protein [Chloroflexota bacterium]MCL5108112.1 lysylphosphatidylglycerol synthase domain-containing protein [Chloroflexota bacterium]